MNKKTVDSGTDPIHFEYVQEDNFIDSTEDNVNHNLQNTNDNESTENDNEQSQNGKDASKIDDSSITFTNDSDIIKFLDTIVPDR